MAEDAHAQGAGEVHAGHGPAYGVLVRFGPVIGLAFLCIVLSVTSEAFLNPANLINVARQVSINAIIAAGMTFVMISGGFDLSVGSVMALSGVVGIMSMNVLGDAGGILVMLGVALACGLWNGVLVAFARINAFVATLAGMTIYHGIALVITDSFPVTRFGGWYRNFGQGHLFGLPIPIYVLIVVYVLAHVVLTRTAFGTSVYAVGGNEEAARLSGINVERVRTLVFSICGLGVGVASLLIIGRLQSAQANMGIQAELDAIAAVVIGGTSLAGGEGRVFGTLAGAFTIGVLNNGLNLHDISAHWQLVAKGVVIALAVIIDRQLVHRQ